MTISKFGESISKRRNAVPDVLDIPNPTMQTAT
jgi:hypothetical protein